MRFHRKVKQRRGLGVYSWQDVSYLIRVTPSHSGDSNAFKSKIFRFADRHLVAGLPGRSCKETIAKGRAEDKNIAHGLNRGLCFYVWGRICLSSLKPSSRAEDVHQINCKKISLRTREGFSLQRSEGSAYPLAASN